MLKPLLSTELDVLISSGLRDRVFRSDRGEYFKNKVNEVTTDHVAQALSVRLKD